MARAREKYGVAGRGFYGGGDGGGDAFQTAYGLEDVETSVKRAVEESFLTSVPTSRFPSLSSFMVNLS